jgi:hypothetical protein
MQRTALQTSASVLLPTGGAPPQRRAQGATKIRFNFTAPPATAQRPQSGLSSLSTLLASSSSTAAASAFAASAASTSEQPAGALAATGSTSAAAAAAAAAVAAAREATAAAATNASAAVAARVAARADAASARRTRDRANLPQSELDRADMREARDLLRRRDFAHRVVRPAQRVIPGNPAVQPEVKSYLANRPLTHHAQLKINNTVTESIRDVASEDANHWRRDGTGTVARGAADRGEWIADVCSITNVGYHHSHRSMVMSDKTHGGAASSQLKSRAQRFPAVQVCVCLSSMLLLWLPLLLFLLLLLLLLS